MKKVILIFIIAAIVIATTVLWFVSSGTPLNIESITGLGVITILIVFALFIGMKRFGSIKRGEPAEDELSKKIMLKTAALSYYISLYMWLVLLYLSDRLEIEAHTQIAAGLLAMSVSFAISWIIVKLRGFRNG